MELTAPSSTFTRYFTWGYPDHSARIALVEGDKVRVTDRGWSEMSSFFLCAIALLQSATTTVPFPSFLPMNSQVAHPLCLTKLPGLVWGTWPTICSPFFMLTAKWSWSYLSLVPRPSPKSGKRVWCSERQFLSHGAGPYFVKNVIIAFLYPELEFLTPQSIRTTTQPGFQKLETAAKLHGG